MAKNQDFTTSDLSKFLSKEAFSEKNQVLRIVESDPGTAITAGDVLGPLKLQPKENGLYVLRANSVYFSRFRSGDRAALAVIESKQNKFKKLKETSIRSIRFPEPGVIEVLLPGDELSLAEDKEFFLLPISFEGLKWQIRKRLHDIEASGIEADHHPINTQKIRRNFSEFAEKLNPVQRDALNFLIDNDLNGLVQGPPGTGKTHLLVDLIRLAVKSGVRVGIASLTHAAVDNALARVIESGVDPANVVRVAGDTRKVRSELYKGLDLSQICVDSFRKITSPSEFDDKNEHLVYAATLHSWCISKQNPEIDLLIIDEASQVPLYFHPFLKFLCSRVIMFGDHKQLPPVIQVTNHNLPAEDIFTYEIERGDYPMLETQYRMNQDIQDWSSRRFYKGRLHPDESNRNRDVIRGRDTLSGRHGSKSVNLIRHDGHASNNANKIEACLVADLVWALRTEGSLGLEDIGIVTPHRTQAGAICAHLQDKLGLAHSQMVLVDTAERFQGQEREAMILSMGVERDNSLKGDRGFLGDGRRLNVAVTRARSRFYCVAPDKLIENTQKQKNAEHLNSFLDWCASGASSSIKKGIG